MDEAALWLRSRGIEALPCHACPDAETRRADQQRFLHEEGSMTMASLAFRMGIDKPEAAVTTEPSASPVSTVVQK
jgi:ATP-dependent DNA helicase RecQ